MNGDLVKQLRDMGCTFCNDLHEDAADEIERLRVALTEIKAQVGPYSNATVRRMGRIASDAMKEDDHD